MILVGCSPSLVTLHWVHKVSENLRALGFPAGPRGLRKFKNRDNWGYYMSIHIKSL